MSIIQAIKEHQLSKLSSQEVGSERYISNIKKSAEIAKLAVKGEFAYSRQLEAQRLYYAYKNKYLGKNTSIAPLASKKAISFWTGVVEACEKAGTSMDVFMSAQFNWFNSNFGTYPKFANLRTPAAIQRAQAAVGIAPKKAVARYQSTDNFAEIMRTADKQVRDMCSAQKLSRKEFYSNFVLSGIVALPKQFLEKDPAYIEALKESNE